MAGELRNDAKVLLGAIGLRYTETPASNLLGNTKLPRGTAMTATLCRR